MQKDLAIFKGADAVFRTACVEKERQRNVQPLADRFEQADALQMIGVGAVREVQARHVHARLTHGGERFFIRAGRAHGAYDFCFSHIGFSKGIVKENRTR